MIAIYSVEYEMNSLAEQLRWQRWFCLFIFLHVLAWTCIPYFTRYTLPMDSMEGYVWGRNLEWGYDKNPFLNGWLTYLAVLIDNYRGWAIYLFSQLSVALCFVGTWLLAKKILPLPQSFLAVVILESSQYYNLHAIDFNDNTLGR
jgi:hypothetical protein